MHFFLPFNILHDTWCMFSLYLSDTYTIKHNSFLGMARYQSCLYVMLSLPTFPSASVHISYRNKYVSVTKTNNEILLSLMHIGIYVKCLLVWTYLNQTWNVLWWTSVKIPNIKFHLKKTHLVRFVLFHAGWHWDGLTNIKVNGYFLHLLCKYTHKSVVMSVSWLFSDKKKSEICMQVCAQ